MHQRPIHFASAGGSGSGGRVVEAGAASRGANQGDTARDGNTAEKSFLNVWLCGVPNSCGVSSGKVRGARSSDSVPVCGASAKKAAGRRRKGMLKDVRRRGCWRCAAD